ncbi:MAG TPA: excinuclease ABC subunit UvrA [Povalibacter sp.]|uniref:excinuclease ABC subunit UvrA n=1 Tax=Povalibacter sp. TaxID=1962978 RepID=UPI002B72B425|nr:excinuclease ABC subunit UvrA [Povalibacter sp.]HMN45536.1 excinuclease ABC subunit UvrA [Povalibacter sp.]
MSHSIVIRGARQNNLKNLDVDLPTNELIVVTGVSGSGKSSLVFDTLYAEGQRRYVETFSPYARQFLDRMDKPQVDRIEGIPPAIAIDQTNPVRTSRSTVGTMTELNDHLKLLYARAAQLYCRGCGKHVKRDSAETIRQEIASRVAAQGLQDARFIVTFPVVVPHNFTEAEVVGLLEKQGYTRVHARHESEVPVEASAKKKGRKKQAMTRSSVTLEMIQDRLRFDPEDSARLSEALEAALRVGQGRVNVHVPEEARPWRFSADLHCADCDIHYQEPVPSLFSFNSPLGACESCRGFGRIIGIDFGLIVPDENKTLAGGAIRPWQTESYRECQDDLMRFARKRSIPTDRPWKSLTQEQRDWVLEGEGNWSKQVWYGVRRFFQWLETKAYKMHIRVLLSKYRAYTPCETCHGARLKPDALLWRLGGREMGNGDSPHFHGFNIHELMLLPIDRCKAFFDSLQLPAPLDEAADLVLREVRGRLGYLMDVGLGYLTLDRQSRTLSGGEVQRINLTTALGTSLVNTLFVLDEPSIGLHPRDMGRVIGVMQRLKEAGNSLVVVEHDPQVMQAADRLLDVGPGPGERGGEIVFYGKPGQLRSAQQSLTADYLLGRREVSQRQAPTLPSPASGGGKRIADALVSSPPPLAGEGRVGVRAQRGSTSMLRIRGARQHNLKHIDVEIPLQCLVAVTGVSGSGKSTLIQDILYPALRKHFGKPTEAPGSVDAIEGAEHIGAVVMVDQAPIGRTTRSNPASYVGAFDAIRKLFAAAPMAKERKYTIGTFSFNSGNGRCPTCGGNGFEHVEMQFLSDVYLRCPDCSGRRYRAEILEVKLARAGGQNAPSIADVLDMTVHEAVEFFADQPEVLATLQPLADVGLDYLKLGQPVPTLSGGEAQRLKLAGHLAEKATGDWRLAAGRKGRSSPASRQSPAASDPPRGTLFLFDEPTTGLHFDDIAKLLRSFRQLIAAGHTVLVIEHNLDVIGASDWLIDLGPEGGDAGGEVVVVGAPSDVKQHATSHTGKALREYEKAAGDWLLATGQKDAVAEPAAFYSHSGQSPAASRQSPSSAAIRVHGAREHNLKNIDVTLPRNRFTVVTGVSGSGKSTLAFDIVFGEGQRRYLESLNAYARQFVQPASRPDVDAIFGIPPTVAIEQRTSRGGRKSTVATLTEVYHFLRLLYVKLGTQFCPTCEVAIEPQSFDAIAAKILKDYRGSTVTVLAPLVIARKGIYKDLAAWAAKKGFEHLRVDGELLPTRKWPKLDRFKEHSIELPVATLAATAKTEKELREALGVALEHGKGVVGVLASSRVQLFSTTRACPSCGTSFAELDPRLFSFNSKLGWCEGCYGTGIAMEGFDAEQSGEETVWNEWYEGESHVCGDCNGQRLNPVARHVLFRGQSITAATDLSVADLRRQFKQLKLQGREQEIARDVLAEISSRLTFLEDVGLGYLQLSRSAPTLSGGEAQRIRLAAQLGSNLQGVCYILDEPTIGLHPRDNDILLDTLDKLADKGNSLLVVEHDEDTIRRADYVVDLGPGAGSRGGRVVAAGTAAELERSPHSVTGRLLSQPLLHPLAPRRGVNGRTPSLLVKQTSLHNLHKQNVRVPLGRLVVVTGVSGSGKSTLARDVLHDNLRAALADRRKSPQWQGCREIAGWESIERILEVDQTPIGKTPRSCPATYVGFWDAIRRLFAETTEARMRGYEPTRFSFNTSGGRCEACEGQGVQRIEMSFLPDVRVTCDSCGGRRFNHETLAIQYKGRSIGDVLMMSVDEAVEFFAAHSRIHHALRLLQDVGLGYLTLGQQSPTLSGGEAQRIKLVTELAKVAASSPPPRAGESRVGAARSGTLFLLDEPTVGLHMADVEKLIRVLHRLVDAGNSVVVIEHNLDVMAEADWLIDMGPEGGDGGGQIVAEGSPEEVIRIRSKSHTARILREFLGERWKKEVA